MNRYLTELIGTFFLVLTIGLSVHGAGPFAPLAIGSSLMVMVYMGGHISGAHYNPAVTLAVFLRGKLPPKDVVPYMAFQVGGAVAAAAAIHFLTKQTLVPAPSAAFPRAFLNEGLYTFALALVVLNVATSAKTQNNSYYGLAIGFTVTAAAYAGGGISGGAYNPAVGVGPILYGVLADGASLKHIPLYLGGPFAGGALAAIVFKIQDRGD